MKKQNIAKPDQMESIPEVCQDNAKTGSGKSTARGPVRSGAATASYWRERLYRNTYLDRHGERRVVSGLYVRMHHEGLTRQVRLPYSERTAAAEEAARLYLLLREHGWQAITSRQERHPSSPSIDEYCEHYRAAAASMERPPRDVSIRLYCRCLKQLCQLAEVRQIRHLTREAVERARDAYRQRARKERRPESAVQNTITKVIRNAKACFSREALAILARRGVKVENPFDGIRLTQEIQPVFALPGHVVERIWLELPLLRDGDPEAGKQGASKPEGSGTKPARAQGPRVDFRKPRPASYAAVLLALACGLRANEIDKARWSWFGFDDKGECFLAIREERDFRPKGGSARILKVPRLVYDALAAARWDLSSPYLLGGAESASETVAVGESYRSPDALHYANAWLRLRGIEAEKRSGNPLHRLRKQFGSALATEYGLFAAQKLLGHSSPTVTAKYYAAQTELPTLTHVRILG